MVNKPADTKIPGLKVNFFLIENKLFATIIHIKSGKAVMRFEKEPLQIGKREFIRRLDSSPIAKGIDWNSSENKLISDELIKKSVWHMHKIIRKPA